MIRRWFTWFGIVVVLIRLPVAIAQISQSQLMDISVRIDVEGSFKEDGGSGVIIRQQGQIYTILTAYHVVKEKQNYKVLIFNPSNRQIIDSHIIDKNSIKQIADYDLAEITIQSSAKYRAAQIGDSQQLQPTDNLSISGYPLPSFSIPKRLSTPTHRLGQFIYRLPPDALPKGTKGATLKMDVATEPGMSGGAVVNKNGELVGILAEADKDASGNKSSSLAIPINLYPQWQAIRSSQRLPSQSTTKLMTEPDNSYPHPECSSFWLPFQSLRYQPQKSINIGYQADKKYLNVELARLVNKSFIKQYDNRLISFTASFQTISDDFWIYGQLGQVSQVERSRYFLALISPIRAFSLTGVLIDKGKFDDILKISANSIVKIEGYATVRDAFVKVSSSQYVLAENAENLLIEAHQIQVIC
jgi:hypothetical protein